MIRTFEVLGEENFKKICQKFDLTEEETKTLREIIEKWDALMVVSDFEIRLQKKMEVAIPKIAKFPSERQAQILPALLEINLLFAELGLKRR